MRKARRRGQIEPAVLYGGVVATLLVVIAVLSMALLRRGGVAAGARSQSASAPGSTIEGTEPADMGQPANGFRPEDSDATVDSIQGRGNEMRPATGVSSPGVPAAVRTWAYQPPAQPTASPGFSAPEVRRPLGATPDFAQYMQWLGQREAYRRQLVQRDWAAAQQLAQSAARIQDRRSSSPEHTALWEAGRAAMLQSSRDSGPLTVANGPKPPVPNDCSVLDTDYTNTITQEFAGMRRLIADAAARSPRPFQWRDPASDQLAHLDARLMEICRTRGIAMPFRIGNNG